MQSLPFPPGSSLNAYCRDSGGDSQDLSVGQQEGAIRAWCAEHGFILVHVFSDAAQPGSSTVGRQGFQDMMHHFRGGAPEAGLVIWSYNRFARDIDDSQFFRADLRRRGYILYSINDKIPDGPMGRLFEAAIDWKNEQFLEDLSRDVKRGLHDLVLNHRAVPGTPPRGFIRQPLEIGTRRDGKTRTVHRWVPDPETAPLVQLAFQMRAQGHSLAEINRATRLYGSLNSYTTFFSNPLYKGELRFGELVIPDYCTPVVDPELWDAVQKIIARHAGHRNLTVQGSPENPRRVASSYVLSGLSFCARCGSPHYGQSARQRNSSYYRRYACTRAHRTRDCSSQAIPAEILEAAVLDELRMHVLDPAHLDHLRLAVLSSQQSRQEQVEAQRRRLNTDLAAVRGKITRITSAIADSGHSRSLLSTLHSLETDEAEILAELAKLDNQLKNVDYQAIDHNSLAEHLRRRLESDDPRELRMILRGLVQRVLVDRDGPEITGQVIYYYPPELPPPKD